MTESAASLLEFGNTLREEDPVLWAIVRGRSHVGKIGILTGQPYKVTHEAIGVLVREKKILPHKSLSHIYYLNKLHPGADRLLQLRKLYEQIELKWITETEMDYKRSDISSEVYNKLNERRAKAEGTTKSTRFTMFDEDLTLKQAQMIALAHELAGESTFRPVELSRAQGYTQAGYTKQTLMALGNKGFMTETKAYPTTWKLTPAGVEKARKVHAMGIPSLVKRPED